jgi:aspartate aminotransferase
VDYDGAKVYDAYQEQTPKTHSERIEFVQNNAPKVVAGLTMLEKFFDVLKKDAVDELMLMKKNLKIPN